MSVKVAGWGFSGGGGDICQVWALTTLLLTKIWKNDHHSCIRLRWKFVTTNVTMASEIVITTKLRHYIVNLQPHISALESFFPKSFKGAFSFDSCFNVCEVWAKSVRAPSRGWSFYGYKFSKKQPTICTFGRLILRKRSTLKMQFYLMVVSFFVTAFRLILFYSTAGQQPHGLKVFAVQALHMYCYCCATLRTWWCIFHCLCRSFHPDHYLHHL